MPLKDTDPEPVIDLNLLLNEVYDQAGYDLVLDYTQPFMPPLAEADLVWKEN